ncbi:Eco57I restriction-modification methylase domain-containing protein [Coprococcus sp. B2-R-112]|uniref:Eco57I restriction-modification methylase domain-containing protein n=1 Tax=Coprococcus sp. B2-R-112 TaxID=2949662 RepID=UPI00202F749B|nr:Eco57I restriction-modification methylase domain-containing protein [Coprococcus sp. B2-R-112]MCM0661472.1 Eco57I restriction-modification methylase domain-containing protein [Coprococcus sp. B2-R-112]
MDNNFKNAFEYKVIYVFTIEDDAHKGLVKIGDATLHTDLPLDRLTPNSKILNQAALKRIKAYTNTAGLTPKLLHSEVAVRTIKNAEGSIKIEAFRDHNIHEVLRNSGIDNVQLGESSGKEWFPIDVEMAKKAIDAVKHNYANLSNTDVIKHTPIIFRPEQAECITKVVKHFKKADRFLINAKMRYGKTFVSLEIVKQCKFKKTIILTHRPVVDAGWYEDFTKIFYGVNDYIYGSKTTGYSVEQLLETGKNFIYFASIQDLRGSETVGGKFDKNNLVFKTVWDCVIVDEAHEGTTTALGEDTVKAVFKEGSGTKLLSLSGTPFNILTDYDENSIYTWDYIMEQESKSEWDKLHFGDHNPYDELPELRIYTYSLGDILKNSHYITFEDKAFNFHEFFRTFTGDFSVDYADMPQGTDIGDFVHEADVWSFLNLMTVEDDNSQYPYSNEEYRSLFKHSLWIVPGVREAKALKKLMLKHPVFGNGMFDIVNVAGSGDEEEKSEEALSKVKRAINKAKKNDTYTITLSCGKLTTGVTIKEWTAVFMLAGSFSTSAANYLQTIFRVQSPCNEDGKIKETAYVFDFAPDRTLKMVSSAVQISSRAGKTKIGDKQIMGKFLNYCPVIAVLGSEMQEYSATKLLQQLKRAYADRVVQNGFDDTNLYNDELFKLDQIDIKKFDELKGIIGTSKAAPKSNEIKVNAQGLTNEEYEEQEKLNKKKKKDLTPEEKARLEELKKKKKVRNDAISILRGISIRMPLLIYGADIPYDEEITLDRFVDVVDDSSWDEFMPDGVTKKKFKEFQKYYDEEVFIAAGRRIRNIAKEADTLDPTERVKKISSLFSCFKNPDKETVLTPWRVVNMHISDCIGGWCFYDESFNEESKLDEPRYVDQGKVTRDIFGKDDPKILEINSKTGLYPLLVAYSVYRSKLNRIDNKQLSIEDKQKLWMTTVKENIFVICKTPMAKAITKRTLIGYNQMAINAHYFDDLLNIMSNKPQLFVDKVLKASYWKKEGKSMKFDAIVGNPPYQSTTSGGIGNGKAATQAKPIFQLFVQQAKKIAPEYISMIIPARWYNGGMGLNDFRRDMLDDKRMQKLVDFYNAKDCFPTVEIAGGLCYFLWSQQWDGDCEVINKLEKEDDSLIRSLSQFGDLFIRSNKSISIINKVLKKADRFWDQEVSALDTFGISSKEKGHEKYQEGDIQLLHSVGFNGQSISYINPNIVTKNRDLINKYKIKISIMIPQGGETGVQPANGYRSISGPQILNPGVVDTFSYLNVAFFDTEIEAKNFLNFLIGKFARYMMRTTFSSVHLSKNNFIFVPAMDFKEQWTDEKLYKYFELDDHEIELIENTMRVIEL